jgi:hypothetical protein
MVEVARTSTRGDGRTAELRKECIQRGGSDVCIHNMGQPVTSQETRAVIR